eukprot:gene3788-7522_t
MRNRKDDAYSKGDSDTFKKTSWRSSSRIKAILAFMAVMGIILTLISYNRHDKLFSSSSSVNSQSDQVTPVAEMGSVRGAKEAISNSKPKGTTKAKSIVKQDKCEKQWRPDRLIGRCFGLKMQSELPDIKDLPKINSTEECRDMCCAMGDKCVTYQFADGTKTCKMGDPVRLGGESADTALWCEPNAPVRWNGFKIKSREGGKCTSGDPLPSQCFGMGPERMSEGTNSRMNAKDCAAACCAKDKCRMWQELPDRGCYFSWDDEEHYCDPYLGTFDGARKCIPGFCGGKETPTVTAK